MGYQLKHYILYFAKHLTQDQCILHDEGGGDGYLLPSNTLSTDYPIEADRGRGGTVLEDWVWCLNTIYRATEVCCYIALKEWLHINSAKTWLLTAFSDLGLEPKKCPAVRIKRISSKSDKISSKWIWQNVVELFPSKLSVYWGEWPLYTKLEEVLDGGPTIFIAVW